LGRLSAAGCRSAKTTRYNCLNWKNQILFSSSFVVFAILALLDHFLSAPNTDGHGKVCVKWGKVRAEIVTA